MFTGIIEQVGEVVSLNKEAGNLHIEVKSAFSEELKIDQSVAHNGVCLTVVELKPQIHVVTAIDETLQKSNIGSLQVGDLINLERCMTMGGRLDGHIVQGHVDQVAKLISLENKYGSWVYRFQYDKHLGNVTVEKGSICVNGVSLTVVESDLDAFSVHIIPYTHAFTNFKNLKIGDVVNLEFDIIGKYVARLMLH